MLDDISTLKKKKNRDENTEPAFLNLFGLRPLLTTSAAEDVQTLKGRVTSFLITFFPGLHLRRRGPSINDITHLGGGGSAKRCRYSKSLFSKMGEKGLKISKIMGNVIYGWPHSKVKSNL